MPLFGQRAGPTASRETCRREHRGHKAFPEKKQEPGRLPKRSRKKDIDKITLEDFAEEFLGRRGGSRNQRHREELLSSPDPEGKIVELTILIIGGMGSYEDRLQPSCLISQANWPV